MHALLAARSNFSIGESILTIERLVEAAKKAGAKALALTDTMSITSMIDFTGRCQKAGIKPVIGCRLRLVDDHTWRKPPKKEGKVKAPLETFLTYYVLSETGLKALFRLLSLANDEHHFYFNSKLSFFDLYKELDKLSADDVAIASSDVYSVFHRSDAREILANVASALSASNTFLTVSPIDTPLFDTLNKKAIELSRETGYPLLITRPVFYDEGGADATEVMGAICSNTPLSSLWNLSNAVRDFSPMTGPALARATLDLVNRLKTHRGDSTIGIGSEFGRGLKNTETLVDMVKFEWKKQPVSLPKMAPDEFMAVVQKCKEGWKKRFVAPVFGHVPSAPELAGVYRERLAYELSVLRKLNFSGYFLLVDDVVNFAKSKNILVGPGRGSVGGSLVAYLMGITECDPIRFGLLFERFINPDRIDLPDADLDFMSARRHEVVEYLTTRYGAENVAGVSNFGTLGTASAIRDVGKAFGLEERVYACSKLAPKKHGANLKLEEAAEQVAEIAAFRDALEPIWGVCLQLEGVMRNLGQHAAGMIVGGVPIVERAVIEHRKGDERVVCWDKRQVEEQGLVKMDILGLETLDIIDLTCQYIRERHSKKVNLLAIPLDDEKVLTKFAEGKTIGIFQYESGGIRRLLKELGKGGQITFEDITAASALYRPGPMESGMMDSFWKRKQGLESVEYDHPLMEPVLRDTFGVMVYQEQIMQVSRVIAGYSPAGADKLRKIMGKKLPEEMKKERGKFVDGCVATIACDTEWAGRLFDKIEGFAGYGFNRSHSVEYALISYQAMFLKTYFPVEYYAATLTLVGEDKLPALLADAKLAGIEVEVPDINLASARFEIITDTRLMIPFHRIKGLSENAAKAIVEARGDKKAVYPRFMNQADFTARVNKRLCNSAKIAALEKVGAFASIEPTHLPSNSPTRIKDQRELIPGLINALVPVNRDIELDEPTLRRLEKLYNVMLDAVKEDGIPVRPYIGGAAQIAIVFDAPSTQEEAENMMFLSSPSRRPFALERVQEAIDEVGLSVEQIYWTALIKRPKEGKQVSAGELKTYKPFFDKEIDIVKPPVIVLMGGQAVRYFFPDFKGKASDEAGQVHYSAALDANLIVGFNPGEIFFAPEKQENLKKVFDVAQSLIV